MLVPGEGSTLATVVMAFGCLLEWNGMGWNAWSMMKVGSECEFGLWGGWLKWWGDVVDVVAVVVA